MSSFLNITANCYFWFLKNALKKGKNYRAGDNNKSWTNMGSLGPIFITTDY